MISNHRSHEKREKGIWFLSFVHFVFFVVSGIEFFSVVSNPKISYTFFKNHIFTEAEL